MPIDDVVIVDLDDNQLESPYLAADLEGFPASSVCLCSVCVCVRVYVCVRVHMAVATCA